MFAHGNTVRDPNQALSIHEVLTIQGVLEGQWREALVEKDWEALFDIATTGAVVVTGMGTAFRGE